MHAYIIMDKIEEQTIEDGELTSDYESDGLTINNHNNDTSMDSHSNNHSTNPIKMNLDFKNLLSDFEIQIKNKSLTENYKNNKKIYKYPDDDQAPIEEDDNIFVRGASPTSFLFSDANSFCRKKAVCKNNKTKSKRSSKKNSKSENPKRNQNSLIDQNEASNSSSSSTMSSSMQQLKICKYYLQDKCGKTEKNCTFLHSQFPCKYYYLGLNCPDENKCKLKHGGLLSDEMKEALLLHIKTAPKEILGDFKMSHNHAKMLLSQRLAELACTDKKSLENKSTFYQTKSENNKTDMNLAHTGNSALPDLLKIEQFNDIFNKSQIEALKKIGVLFSYQLLALSMIELNRCGISVMQIVKIQEKIKKTDNIKVFNTDNTNTELAVGMQSDGNKNSLQGCVKDTYFEKLSPPEFSTHLLCNMETEDCEEECDLIIDEEACSTSDGDIEFSKPDIKNNAKENYVKQSTELQNSNKQNTQSLKEVEVKDLSKHSEIFYKKIQKVSKIVATDFPLKYNDDKLNTNESNVRKITKCDPLLVEINDYAKPLRKISTNINTLEDIKIITTGELDMRLPFNSVLQNYKPATECDGSFVPHSIIPWKLFEIVLPTKVPMSLEQIEKLQQSNDPRIRKRIINQEIYSFEGNFHDLSKEFPMDSNCVSNSVDNNNNDSKNNILYKKDFLDPRKLHISNSTYEHFKQPTVMQTLQYYLHHSTWYNKQNSKAKMEINELIADLAAYLKKFKQDNRLNKKFCLNKLKYHSQILNILNNLKIFIDSNGSILPEKAISDMNYGTENTGFTLFGGFERFWGTLPSNQRQLPVISNLVPVGSFQAPMPVHFNKPALLGFHSNDITGVGCNNSFQATAAAVHTKTMNFANNILYGNQNFTFHFENCRSQFPQSSVALNSNLESFKASNEVNSYGSRNNLKYRNNSKLSDRYSNKKNKRFNNKYCNNSENGGFSNKDNEENISTFENDKNNNKCDVICNKKIKQRRKVSENWDEEDEPIKALEKCASNSETSKTFEGKEENWDSDDENENSINNSSEQKLKDCPVKNFDSINDFGTVSKKQKLENIRCTTTDTEKTSLKSEKSNFENHVCSKSPKHEENLCFANNIEISKVVADDSEEEWD